jgi:predicted NAD/FAD-binding protein
MAVQAGGVGRQYSDAQVRAPASKRAKEWIVGKICIIGGGISGLTAAYFLSRRYEVHVFEKDSRLGGHTDTHRVESLSGEFAVDTGFIVHNQPNYPSFVRLLKELGVETAPSDMSFSVYSPRTGFEYSSRGARGFFADRRNCFRPSHFLLLAEILRFNRSARAARTMDVNVTIGGFLENGRYTENFRRLFLVPMTAAIWSTSPERILDFPARTLITFLNNHGLLSVNDHPQWRVIRGGSRTYLAPLTRPFRDRIRLNAGISRIERDGNGVTLRFHTAPPETFDHVVLACHGDQVLPLLAAPTKEEEAVFAAFHTTRNQVVLHTDSGCLPRGRDARASWNYNIDGIDTPAGAPTVTYHMNRLQGLSAPEDYCVTLNSGSIDPASVLAERVYNHPLYSRDAVLAQARWNTVSGRRRTHYCGAYWFNGFHEDGVNSALRVARHLGVAC